jgi:pantothenate kinase type III
VSGTDAVDEHTPGDYSSGVPRLQGLIPKSKVSVIFLELGNTTMKLARPLGDDTFMLERFASSDEMLRRIERLDEEIVCAPVGAKRDERLLARLEKRGATIITREMLGTFVGTSYDTPETLGIDRVLNLMGLDHDAIVISCGTAITVDARMGGRPVWGAIMAGFATAAQGLHTRIPVLPLVDVSREPRVPARTSLDSVANGVLLGTARAAQGIAAELAFAAPPTTELPVILTGGDAQILERLWPAPAPVVDEMLLFAGMARAK